MPEVNPHGEAYRNIRICVDAYDRSNPEGRFYHPGLERGGREFHSLTELLVSVENLLDEAKFPQSFTARRSFAPVTETVPASESAETAATKGKKATFNVRLLFRQHASWQGSVTWIEGRGEQSFRSVLELILLLDSAMNTVNN